MTLPAIYDNAPIGDPVYAGFTYGGTVVFPTTGDFVKADYPGLRAVRIGGQWILADDLTDAHEIGVPSPSVPARILPTLWTPALQATTTNPTLGTGSDIAGQYSVGGGMCHGWARWRFGTAAVNAGSGTYFITPPVAPHSGIVVSNTFGEPTVVGTGTIRDNGAGAGAQRTSVAATFGSSTQIRFWVDGGGTTQVADNHPQTWAASDRLAIQFAYPVAVGADEVEVELWY